MLSAKALIYDNYETTHFSNQERNSLLYVATKNHARGVDNPTEAALIGPFLDQLNHNINDTPTFLSILDSFLSKYEFRESDIQLVRPTIHELGVTLAGFLSKEYSLFTRLLMFNYILHKNSLCPLVLYSFNTWKIPNTNSKVELQNAISFSIVSLLRIVPFDSRADLSGYKILSVEGGLFDIYINHNTTFKVPKNAASFYIMSSAEMTVVNRIGSHQLRQYVADNYILDEITMILSHTFIPGKNGEEVLAQQGCLDDMQLQSLRELYEDYVSFRLSSHIILDIHPANFIWNIEDSKWYLIDVGPIPYIGSEYYQHKSFQKYYDFVWLDRERQKIDIPIRSLDYSR